MTKNGKMQQMVMRVLAVMLVASFLLAVAAFVPLQSALADGGPGVGEGRVEPNIICTCCQGYWFCWDAGTDYLCYNGTWYHCNEVKYCDDRCCLTLAKVGYGCSNLHQACTPEWGTIQCLE